MASTNELDGLRRPSRPPDPQQTFFEVEPDWREHWWGMPEFEMDEAKPLYQLTVNCLTLEDLRECRARLCVGGPRPGRGANSVWYPPQVLDKPAQWSYVDEA